MDLGTTLTCIHRRILRTPLAARFLALLAAASILAGCGDRPPRVAPATNLFSDTQSVIGIAVAPPPPAAAYTKGPQGLIDMAINYDANDALRQSLEQLDLNQFHPLRDALAGKLRQRGLQVKVLDKDIDPSDYPVRELDKSDRKRFADHDYSGLKAASGIDRLLLIRLSEVGTLRNYYAFIPLGRLSGYARATGQIINLRDGSLQWSATSVRTHEPEPGYGEADFTAVDKAINTAIRSAGAELSDDLVF